MGSCPHAYIYTVQYMSLYMCVQSCVYVFPYGCNLTSLAAKHINLSNTNSEKRSGKDRGCVGVCGERVNERYTPPSKLRRAKKKFGFHEALER